MRTDSSRAATAIDARASHYCEWDRTGRTVRALCGVLIKRVDHANEPTCDRCRAHLAAREELDRECP